MYDAIMRIAHLKSTLLAEERAADCRGMVISGLRCRARAAALADQLQSVYLKDKKVSESVKAGILETLGLLVEAAPEVRTCCETSHCPITCSLAVFEVKDSERLHAILV